VGQETRRRRTRLEMMMNDEPPSTPSFKPQPQTWSDSGLTAAWIGHATVLINYFGRWIITDPVLSERIGINVANLFTIGPRRLVSPALSFDELPKIDLILLSHAHMDHLDIPTLRKFDRHTPVVIAKNTFDVIEDLGFQEVYELDWGEYALIGDLRIEALEVKHFGWRYPWEKDRSRGYWDGRSYNAYLISGSGRHVVFGGDTAYQEFFKRLSERNLSIDVALMPIGAYDPWIRNHCTPEQALEMSNHMNARYILPIHWNTFIQSEEPTAEPMERLRRAAQPERIALHAIGETWTLPTTAEHPFVPCAPEDAGA
jgi:L-ascorbate metabolism protein UlaG (beta-lactamase superfamily)